ncbi:hypothetical protein [Methylobacterium fujisawaense]|uniref:hypothetical protein n=1 Tax=Methylobacterium fujisawaense TaxID=107400 RepID=UPI00313CA3B2
MPSETNRPHQDAPAQEPILELWRIIALALIVAAGMLFVHLIVPTEADASAAPSTTMPPASAPPEGRVGRTRH